MALNSSGQISLAGTTAGQSIELELGGGGMTVISLNDATVRTLAGVASGQISMPTDFWGKSAGSYWIGIRSAIATSSTYYRSIISDSSGNIYFFTQEYTVTSNACVLIKLDKDGNLIDLKQNYNGQAFPAYTQYSLAIDSTNTYLLVVGEIGRSSTRENCCIRRYNLSNLSFVDQMYYSATPASDYGFKSVCIANSNLMFTCGNLGLAAYNGNAPSSTETVVKSMPSTASVNQITCDNSGNVFSTNFGTNTSLYRVQKYDSSLNTLAALASTAYPAPVFNSIDYNNTASQLAVSFIGATSSTNTATAGCGAAKLNTSTLSVIWAKTLNALLQNQSSGLYSKLVSQDNSGNVYLITPTVTPNAHLLAKWNSSGILQWQRTISFSGDSQTSPTPSINFDVNQNAILVNVCSTGPSYTTGRNFIFKLNPDGSGTGVYSLGGINVTYATSSFVESSFTMTTTTTITATSTATSQAKGYVAGTQATSNLTFTKQVI